MNWLKELFSETGDVSMMRLLSFISLMMGSGVACYGISQGKDLGGVAQIVGVFVGCAFTGKAAQKFMEKQ